LDNIKDTHYVRHWARYH